MAKNNNSSKVPQYRINGEIYTDNPMVRVIFPDGTNKVIHISEARNAARELELDLIEISKGGENAILKIADHQKMMYELKKKAKKNNAASKPMKEIQLSVSIAENDLKTKASKARKFIEEGFKVKVILTMRGREKARRDENKKSLYMFITMLEDIAIPESMPKDEGDNRTIAILRKK